MKVYIYTLTDPRNGEVRYVGKTINPKKRFYEHTSLTKELREGTYKRRWTAELRKIGLKPVMTFIDTLDDPTDLDWQQREVYWIAHYKRIGAKLTNLDSGGNNGKIMAPESREKCRLIHLGKKRTPEAREKMRLAQTGKKRSPDSLRKQSESCKKAWEKRERKMHPNALIALIKYHTGRKQSEEQITKRTQKLKGLKRTGQVLINSQLRCEKMRKIKAVKRLENQNEK